MKRFATVMTALLLVGVFARPAAAQVDVGLLGGVSFATVGGDAVPDDADPGYVTGVNIGALAQIPLTEIISLQPELHYVQKGADDLGGEGGITTAFNFDYIEIPVLLRVNVPTESRFNFGFLLGPEIAFQVGCDVIFEAAGDEESFECGDENIDASFDFEEFDYGLIFGGSLGYGTPWGEVFLDGRYDLGLAGLFPNNDNDQQLKNRAYYVMVGFTVPLGM